MIKGRDILEKELERQGLDRGELLKSENILKILEPMNFQTEEDLYAAVGFGHTQALTVIHKLAATQPPQEGLSILGKKKVTKNSIGISPGGIDEMVIHRSKCCTPVPGEEVIGYITRGRGMTLHRRDCPNVVAYIEKEPDRLIEVEWTRLNGEKFETGLKIRALDRVGLLNDISAIFSEMKINICSAQIKSLSDKTATFDLMIEVDDLPHLNRLITHLGALSDILEVRRVSTHENAE